MSTATTEPWFPQPMGNDPDRTVVYGEDIRYVELRHVLKNKEKVALIRAPMGTGKSTCIWKFANTLYANARILIVSPRKTFSMSITAELNAHLTGDKFVCYMDKEKSVKTATRVVIQFESLRLLDCDGVSFDYVIIDECESVLTQAISRETNGDHITKNQDLFEQFLRKAKKVFLMDAFLSSRTFRLVKTMELPYTFHWYHRKPVERVAIRYDHFYKVKDQRPEKERCKEQFDQFITELMDQLRQGIRIYAFFSSKEKLKEVQATIEMELPSLKMATYTGDKVNVLNSVREDWKELNLVLTTTSITVGVNYDYSPDNHPEWMFHKVFIYASAASHNLVRDIFQSQMRVRHLRDDELHYFLDPRTYGCSYEKKREQIVEELKELDEAGKQLVSQYGLPYHTTNKLWMDIAADGKLEVLESGRRFQEMFAYYLRANNYADSNVDENELNDETICVEKLGEMKYPYEEVPSISFEQVKEYKIRRISDDPNTPRLTPLEQASLDRYYFDQSIPEDLQLERRAYIWALHYQVGRQECNNIRYELGKSRGLITLADIMSEQTCSMFNTARFLQATVIETICDVLGVANIAELQTVSRERWENIKDTQRFADLGKDARTAFQLQPKDTKKPLTWIHKCVEEWVGGSFKQDKQVQKRVNGVKQDIQGFTLAPADPILPEVLLPLRSKRTREAIEALGEQDLREAGMFLV